MFLSGVWSLNLKGQLYSRGRTNPFIQARAKLKLWVVSPDKSNLTKTSLKPASSPSFLQFKIRTFKLESLSTILEKSSSLEKGPYFL